MNYNTSVLPCPLVYTWSKIINDEDILHLRYPLSIKELENFNIEKVKNINIDLQNQIVSIYIFVKYLRLIKLENMKFVGGENEEQQFITYFSMYHIMSHEMKKFLDSEVIVEDDVFYFCSKINILCSIMSKYIEMVDSYYRIFTEENFIF